MFFFEKKNIKYTSTTPDVEKRKYKKKDQPMNKIVFHEFKINHNVQRHTRKHKVYSFQRINCT